MRSLATVTLVMVLAGTALGQADTPSESIAAAAKRMDELLQGSDPNIAEGAQEVQQALMECGANVSSLSGNDLALYAQGMIRSSLVLGHAEGAYEMARTWAFASKDPKAYRAAIVACMAAERMGSPLEDLEIFKPQLAAWKPWVDYMAPLLAMVGRTVEDVALPLEGGAVFRPQEMGDTLAVLYFWALGPGQGRPKDNPATLDILRQNALVERFARSGVTIIGVNLDEGANVAIAKALAARQKAQAAQVYFADHHDGFPVPRPFPITAVPTVCVLGSGARVNFVGDPRTLDLPMVLHCGVLSLRRRESSRREDSMFNDGGTMMAPRRPLVNLSEPNQAPPSPADAAQAEAEAKALYENGLNQVILGQRTRNPVPRRQGLEQLKDCAALYPQTQWAKMAQDKIQEYAD